MKANNVFRKLKYLSLIFILGYFFVLLFSPIMALKQFAIFSLTLILFFFCLSMQHLFNDKPKHKLLKWSLVIIAAIPIVIHLYVFFDAEILDNSHPLLFSGILFQIWIVFMGLNYSLGNFNKQSVLLKLLVVFQSLLFFTLIISVLVASIALVLADYYLYIVVGILMISWLNLIFKDTRRLDL